MLEENDIVEIVLNQRHIPSGQAITNVFHYLASSVVGDWDSPAYFRQAALDVFTTLHAVMSVYQSNEISWDSAVFRNLTNQLDIATYNPDDPIVGAVASVPEPLQVALSFKLIRATMATRNGSKRIGGIADSIITDTSGSNLVGTADVLNIEEAFSQGIDIVATAGVEVTFVPIILRKAATGVPPTVYSLVAGAEYRGAGSQNSRKQLL